MHHELDGDIRRDPLEDEDAGIDDRIEIGKGVLRRRQIHELRVLMTRRYFGNGGPPRGRDRRQAFGLASGERLVQRAANVLADFVEARTTRGQEGEQREFDSLRRDMVCRLRLRARYPMLSRQTPRGAQIVVRIAPECERRGSPGFVRSRCPHARGSLTINETRSCRGHSRRRSGIGAHWCDFSSIALRWYRAASSGALCRGRERRCRPRRSNLQSTSYFDRGPQRKKSFCRTSSGACRMSLTLQAIEHFARTR